MARLTVALLLPLALHGESGPLGLDRALAADTTRTRPAGRAVRVHWDDRLCFETLDRWARVEVLARMHMDTSTQRASGELGRLYAWEDAWRFRRASLGLRGRVSAAVGFKVRYEYARGDTRFRDAYIEWRELPFGRLRLGQFREPFGLESHTGADYLTFAERSVISRLEPRRATGVLALGEYAEQRGTWAVSVTRAADDQGLSLGAGGDATVSARVTGLARAQADDTDLVHLGASVRIANPRDDRLQVALRPESFLAPTVLDSGATPIERALSYDAQLAWVRGPFSLQMEWTRTDAAAPAGPDPALEGAYVFASWFVTGESRAYNRAKGSFGRVRPARPWNGRRGGPGAWELAARYSFAELDDVANAADEDRLRSLTLGVNWYQTDNARIVFNYIAGEREDRDGRFQGALLRLQLSM